MEYGMVQHHKPKCNRQELRQPTEKKKLRKETEKQIRIQKEKQISSNLSKLKTLAQSNQQQN